LVVVEVEHMVAAVLEVILKERQQFLPDQTQLLLELEVMVLQLIVLKDQMGQHQLLMG
jgi:hypothetical protein